MRGGSNEYPQSMFWAEIWKILEYLSENFQFLLMKFSIYLNRRAFVMAMSQSLSAAFPRHQKEGEEQTKKKQTPPETTDAQTKKNCIRESALEQSLVILLEMVDGGA